MNYPIAMIPYANMAPFEALGPPENCYFVHSTPRNSIAALKESAVWAAAVPVGGLAALEGQVVPVGNYGIAARGVVMSVLFFSDRPFDQFKPSHSVRLTNESASSVRLLYLLLGYTNGFEQMPNTIAAGVSSNGELVIGDTALRWQHEWERQGSVKGFKYMTDLAEQWTAHHQLPFVFARWVVRTDAPRQVHQGVADWLERFSGREESLIDRSVSKVAGRLDLPQAFVRRYLKVIRRCLSKEDQEGQDRFLSEWRRYGADCDVAWFEEKLGKDTGRTHTHG